MFYDTLNALCEERGLKLTNVINELGFSSGNLSRWKSGITPKGATIAKLANYFGVSTDYLLTGKEKTSAGIELSAEEIKIIELIRSLSDEKKEIFKKFLNSL